MIQPKQMAGGEGAVGSVYGAGALGDVVISLPAARRQARERGHALEEELRTLLIHGVLHLLGHDHERGGAPARRMRQQEADLRKSLREVKS